MKSSIFPIDVIYKRYIISKLGLLLTEMVIHVIIDMYAIITSA